jgi:hypothetical protein
MPEICHFWYNLRMYFSPHFHTEFSGNNGLIKIDACLNYDSQDDASKYSKDY